MSDILLNEESEIVDGDVSNGKASIWFDETDGTLKSKRGSTKEVLAYGDTKKMKVSGNDTTEGYLEDKITVDSEITATVQNEGGNENIQLSSSVLPSLKPTGLISGDDGDDGLVSINGGDITKFDMTAVSYFIQGVRYTLAAQIAVDPSFEVGENTSFVGLDSGGFTFSATLWTFAQLKTIVPVARLNAAAGQTGSGSDISLVRDDRFFIDQEGWHRRNYFEHAFGALYHTGGIISKSATALQISQAAGTLFDAQGKEQTLANQNNIDALRVYHIGGAPVAVPASPLIVDVTNYDNGTDLAPIPSNKWVCHTLLKSPKGSPQEGGFFFIYANQVFNNQTEAEGCSVDFSIFTDQHTSGLISVARIIAQQGGLVITEVLDERPFAVGGSGGATTTATPTEQQVYEASTQPQRILNTAQGGEQIRDASTPIAADLWSVLNFAGSSKYFRITAATISAIVPTHADDAAAGIGGLSANDFYKTATGELRIKL